MDHVPLSFSIERPDSEIARALIDELDADLLTRYPGEWIHGLHPEDIVDPTFIFVVARFDGEPVACGALRRLESDVAEVKRMFVKQAFRGKGLSRQLLSFLESTARTSGYRLLKLETGTKQPEAVGLYESAGYKQIPCFGEYVGNPFSLFFEKRL
ncbi:MAG: GNAT family N-acetyltransferase [Ignavibacteriales bacterium]|nr:GNAT family N-acetyltransferase [Ignavibacteriales bacterium]